MAPKGPYKLVTVNKVPARAKILIGRVAEDVKENYTIDYVENAERMEDVKGMVERNQPDVLFVASMWTAEEATEIQSIAKSTKPGIKTMAIPHGLQVEKGPDAVVEFLKEQWPGLVEN
ncbi:alpha beta fold family protein [Rutstroemia sp. NJR-2017a WRK4]|nr:alpha beta fold family protein [Rutstroemia sp. NJR-2017a WRK4]